MPIYKSACSSQKTKKRMGQKNLPRKKPDDEQGPRSRNILHFTSNTGATSSREKLAVSSLPPVAGEPSRATSLGVSTLPYPPTGVYVYFRS